MQLRRRTQSWTKDNCGQIAIAIIANLPIRTIESYFNSNGATNILQLIDCLRHLGFSCDSRLRTYKNPPPLSIARVSMPMKYRHSKGNKYWGHWAVIYKGKLYDSAFVYSQKWPKGAKITSYLEIKEK